MTVSIVLEMLDRAHRGPICSAEDWNLKVLPENVLRKLKEHGLQGSFDPENPVNTDDELADRFFTAGFELAIEMGVLCQDTERVIKVTEEELKKAIENAPGEVHFGRGEDAVVLKHRRPEDKILPLLGAPTGVVFSEEMFVPFTQAVVQYREVDVLEGASLTTVFGYRSLAGTPYETMLGWHEAQLVKEALRKAGRPGMGKIGTLSSPTAYGQLAGFTYGALDPTKDAAMVLPPGEVMTSYSAFHKIISALNCGAKIVMNHETMIGGYSGSPEGAALAHIAMALLCFTVHQADTTGGGSIDVRYLGNCGREGQWTHSILRQAASRNTHHVSFDMLHQVAGPGTEMLLYEDAVSMMQASASGSAGCFATRSSGVRHAEYLSPLECKFCGEVLKRTAGMTRKKVNEIVKVLIPKYENMLYDPPKGKSFRECYDLKTLKPTKECLDVYLRVKKELIDMGVPLDEYL